jgi:hypothetical protein
VLTRIVSGEEEFLPIAAYLISDMSLFRGWKRRGARLLAVLVLISAWGGAGLFAQPGSSCRAASAHACCCKHTGLPQCSCSGSHGVVLQLASLAACAGAMSSFVLARSAVFFSRPRSFFASLQCCGVAPMRVSAALASTGPQPATPPPQAA